MKGCIGQGSSDDDTKLKIVRCFMAINDQDGRITCLPSFGGEDSADGSSSTIASSDASHSTRRSKVTPITFFFDGNQNWCENKFNSIQDAFDYLLEFIAKNDPLVTQIKKDKRTSLKLEELAKVKHDFDELTTKFQENISS